MARVDISHPLPACSLCLILLLASRPFSISCVVDANLSKIQEFVNFIEQGRHDFRTPPPVPPSDPSLRVKLALWINAITDIEEINMDFTLNLYFEQIWTDSRLSYAGHQEFNGTQSISIPHALIPTLWLPDAYFENGKEETQHIVTLPNNYMRVFPNGTVRYDQRLTLKLWCNVYLENFPHDNQTCTMKVASYRYTMEELVYQWRDVEPIEFGDAILLARYTLVGTSLGDCTTTYSTGNYSCVSVMFHMRRQVGYYMLQIYVPAVLIVLLSWVSFWLDPLAVPGRVSLGILTVLTMATQAAQQAAELPKVSYIKAIDVWMTGSMCFLVTALLEFAIVNSLARREISRGIARTLTLKHRSPTTHSTDENGVNAEGSPTIIMAGELYSPTVDQNIRQRTTSRKEDTQPDTSQNRVTKTKTIKTVSQQMDNMSRIIFPMAFLLFNCLYWSIYLSGSSFHGRF